MKLNHPLSIALLAGGFSAVAAFVFSAGAQVKVDVAAPVNLESAIFAGGCFWCVESDFDKLDGVVETISGYTGGTTSDPTYRNHTRDQHLEAVKVIYDPAKVEYGELVEYFMQHVDPTDAGGQFCDRGHSYTTAIFVGSSQERDVVTAEFAQINASGVLPGPIVTPVRDEVPFHDAETYHQDYYLKNPARYRFYRAGCGRDERVKAVWSGKGQS